MLMSGGLIFFLRHFSLALVDNAAALSTKARGKKMPGKKNKPATHRIYCGGLVGAMSVGTMSSKMSSKMSSSNVSVGVDEYIYR